MTNVQTVQDIEDRLAEIRVAKNVGANTAVLGMQDDLVAEVLFAIANQAQISGGQWAQEMASKARQGYRIVAGIVNA